MAFAQNLLEGFAQAAGDQPTVQRIENEKSDRRATQHEELAAQTQSILNDVTGLQQRRGTLDPKSTTYQKDLAENDKALPSFENQAASYAGTGQAEYAVHDCWAGCRGVCSE